MTKQIDWRAMQLSQVLRSSRHYLHVQSQGHHTIDRLEERGMERGSARRPSLKGWERAIVNQTNIGTISKATLGKLLRDRVGFSERIDTIWNWHSLKLFSAAVKTRLTQKMYSFKKATTNTTNNETTILFFSLVSKQTKKETKIKCKWV